MSQKEVQNEPCGVLIIDKPDGMTSHDIVGKVRRLYNTRRVGHTRSEEHTSELQSR